jgi:anaerobic ribonucleoside-triphosphate reductase activating protein
MNYAALKKYDIANGTGVRVSLFVSGCRHRCKGCFNSEAWDFGYGNTFDDNVMNEILDALDKEYIEGFSVLGGEPFEPENKDTVQKILAAVRERFPNKTIWCYSGFTFETLKETSLPVLQMADVLVDGKFVEEKRNLRLKFRGSENQRLIDVQKSLAENKVVMLEEE